MIAPLLTGELGQTVIDAWRPFAAHFDQCRPCQMARTDLQMASHDPFRGYHPFSHYDGLCDEGQSHFVVWADAKIALIVHLRAITAPWGLEGLAEDEAGERAAAIVAMPGPAAAELFREPDQERRESLIRAVIAAHRAGGVRTSREREEDRRQCAADDCTTGPYGTHGSFVVSSRYPRQRYCCDPCRKRAERRERPRIESTED